MLRLLAIIFHLLLATSTGGLALAQESYAELDSDSHTTAILAHRSASMGGQPENTLAWIEHAIDQGIDIIHINPQRTADDEYILMHDNTLNRMTDVESVYPNGPPNGPTREQRGGRDYVGDYTLNEIQELSIRGTESIGRYSVPSLDEALTFIDGRILVMLGLKSYEVESLSNVLNSYGSDNLMLFELYYPGTDQSKLRALADATGIGVSVTPFRSNDYLAELEGIYRQLGSTLKSYWVDSKGLTPELRSRMNELELLVVYSGWDGPEDFALVENDDVGPWQAAIEPGFIAATDQPEVLIEALGRWPPAGFEYKN